MIIKARNIIIIKQILQHLNTTTDEEKHILKWEGNFYHSSNSL